MRNKPPVASPNLTDYLRCGRRALVGLDGVDILQDWQWAPDSERFSLKVRLSPKVEEGGTIPPSSEWFITASHAYPAGEIGFYPAKKSGITTTFPHQLDNRIGVDSALWRSGAICQGEAVHVLGRYVDSMEPLDAERRLCWHTLRALAWLEAAADGTLVLGGDPFELPDFSPSQEHNYAFSENATTFKFWKNCSEIAGTVDLVRFNSAVQVITRFVGRTGKIMTEQTWGSRVKKASGPNFLGLWLRLDFIPVIHPWQAPRTLGELDEILRARGLYLFDLLQPVWKKVRDGNRHPLFIGFPIPEQVGSAPVRYHWQAFLMPVLSHKRKRIKGWREKENSFAFWDRRTILVSKMELEWMVSENWAPDQISTRGRLPKRLTDKKILLIGCGALGSSIAEMLLRGGAHNMVVLDNDIVEAGNLVRHTLDFDDVKKSKATTVAAHLNSLSPFAEVTSIAKSFPPISPLDVSTCKDVDMVIETTGSDTVLIGMRDFSWDNAKTFVSLSFNYGAQDLYCFGAKESFFPYDEFRKQIGPYLAESLEAYDSDSLPREGIGCWHPVFPARSDDVWEVASHAIKYLEDLIGSEIEPELRVYRRSSISCRVEVPEIDMVNLDGQPK